MGSITLSADQQSVVDSRNQNILVSAAAGSGKTRVLTERIAGRVMDSKNPIDIDRVLVVTFTQAAAKEMKERIGKELNKQIALHPEDSHLQKQATLIHGALITTIDSFCLYIIRNHFHKINLDPAFRVASEAEMKLLKQDVLREIIKSNYAKGDEEFYHLVDCYSKKDNDNLLEESLLDLYSSSMSHPWPVKWLENHKTDYYFESKEEFASSDFMKLYMQECMCDIDNLLKTMDSLLLFIDSSNYVQALSEAVEKDIEEIKKVREVLSLGDFSKVADKCNIPWAKAATIKGDEAEDEKKYVSGERTKYKKVISGIKDIFSQDLDILYGNMQGAGIVVEKLTDLEIEFIERLNEEKRNRRILEFSDLSHMAVDILVDDYDDINGSFTPSDVALGYKDYFEEVMVDEYQDSNLVQELIIKSVSREDSHCDKNRFMVGDVKQSIYSFRMARPDIFTLKMDKFCKDSDSPDRLITLKSNYRSRGCVLDSINAVFEDIMTPEYGGIIYDEDARLYKGGDFTPDTSDNKTELVLINKEGDSESALITEIETVAQRILKMRGNFILNNGEKADFKDMALLLRSPNNMVDKVKEIFSDYNIPFFVQGKGAFYDTTEIREVMSFLRVLDNPLDDISLFSAMTSSFGKMDDEYCANIKLYDTADRYLWDRLLVFARDNEKSPAWDFVELIKKYRHLSTIVPIPELINRLFNETGYKYIVAALPNGKQRLANVEMLIAKSSEYAKTSFYGLFHFLRYIELMKKIDENEEEASVFDENANVVKVMSIHKSKGLEFPICFIAGLGKKFNETDLNKEFLFDAEMGIGAGYIDPVKRVRFSTLRKDMIRKKKTREMVGEEIRVLYVGMTRAKEKLIMLGSVENPKDYLGGKPLGAEKKFLRYIQKSVLNNAGTLFDVTVMDELDNTVVKIKKDIDLEALKQEFVGKASMVDDEKVANLKQRFVFSYPYEKLSRLYTKTTVSELKMAAIDLQREESEAHHPFPENETREFIPLFAGGEEIVKGTDRGTAYHNVLQLINFSLLPDNRDNIKDFVDNQLAAIVSGGKMTEGDVEKVNRKKIADFLCTKIARDMANADKENCLFKEQPFVMGVPASMVEDDFPDDEEVLVQGVVDVCFVKNDHIYVLDYKTDRVDAGDELIKRYKKQLDYYGVAMTKLTGKPLGEKIIYSFALNETIIL